MKNRPTSKRRRLDFELRLHADSWTTFESKATCKAINNLHRCEIYIVSMPPFRTAGKISISLLS